MTDRYLWNKTGEPDPYTDALVAQLAAKRYQATSMSSPKVHRRPWAYLILAAAAVLVMALVNDEDDALRGGRTLVGLRDSTTPDSAAEGGTVDPAHVSKTMIAMDRSSRMLDVTEPPMVRHAETSEPEVAPQTVVTAATIDPADSHEACSGRAMESLSHPGASAAEVSAHAPK